VIGTGPKAVTVDPPLALAPMEGVTDVTFRRLVRRIGGVGLVCTEFIPAKGLSHDMSAARKLAIFDPDERPITIQVFGRDPAILAEGARVAERLGADIVDLNMGCPSKRVCSHSGGSALLQDPQLCRQIVVAMRAALTIPFTVKMRSGWDHAHRNAPEIAKMCEDEGVDAITVHWRTRVDGYAGERDLSTVRAVVERVLANGDVLDAASARDTLAQTGAAGLMIGRGAIRNPWVFRQISEELFGGAPCLVDAEERERVFMGYVREIRDRFHSDRATLGRWKKITKYFTEGVAGGSILRDQLLHADDLQTALDRASAWFALLRRYEAGDLEAFAGDGLVGAVIS